MKNRNKQMNENMNIRIFSDFPDHNEILVDGTVFYAESNGMFFFEKYFFYLFVKISKLCFFLKFFLFYH